MRAELRRALPTVTALGGLAEALPLASAATDAIVAAQAFHWFDLPRAAAEFHRVLREEGRLGLIWNERDLSVGWSRELDAIVEPYGGSEAHPKSHHDIDLGPMFGPPVRAKFPHEQRVDIAALRDRVASMSFIAVLADVERARVLDRVVELAASHPDTAGLETFVLPYHTYVFWSERRP